MRMGAGRSMVAEAALCRAARGRDGRGPTRTGDPLGVSEVLWPTELRARLDLLRLAPSAGLQSWRGCRTVVL